MELFEQKNTINNETEPEVETINLPEDCYFIHGVTQWSKNNAIGIKAPEISCSIQKDGFSMPLRPYGYILKIDKGAISRAFDTDVSSKYKENWEKELSEQTELKKYKNYQEDEFEELIQNTKKNSHNELWVNGEKVEIVGAYIKKEENNLPGTTAFIKACNNSNIPIHWIE